MYIQQSIKSADPGKDIWALACVISEAAVWSVLGHTGLVDYHKRRVEATAAIPFIKDTGYAGCFHDTMKVLPVVEQVHNEVFRVRRANIDNVVQSVIVAVGGMMAQNSAKRTNAWSVHEELTRVLKMARLTNHGATTQSPTTTVRTQLFLPSSQLPEVSKGLGLTGHSLQSIDYSQEYQPSPHLPRRVTIGATPRGHSSSGILEPSHEGTRMRSPHARLSPGGLSPRQEETWTRSPRVITPDSARWSQPNTVSGISRSVPQPSTPTGRSACPEASVADVLEYIRRKKLHSGTTLIGERWLTRLHGRDQVGDYA